MPIDERSPAARTPGARPTATAVAAPAPPPDTSAPLDRATGPDPEAAPVAPRSAGRRPASRRFLLLLLAIAAVAFVGRAVLVLQTRGPALPCETAPLCGDALYYSFQANTLGQGYGFVETNLRDPAADHPPLTALVLAPLSVLAPGDTNPITAQRLTMAALGSLAVVLIGLLGRRAAGARGEPVGLIAAVIAAVNANFWMNDIIVMSETLATIGIVLTLLAVYRFLDRPSWAWAAAVGALVGLTGLARAELLLLAPITFVPLALTARTLAWPARLGRVAVAALAAAAVLLPWTAYNATRFTEPVLLSTNDGLTILGANCDRTYGISDGGGLGFWSLQCAYDVADRLPPGDQSVRSRAYRTIGVDYLLSHKSRWRPVFERRLLRGWGLWSPADMAWLNQGEGRPIWASWVGFAQWWLLVPPAVAGGWLLHRRRLPLWPLASMAVIVTVTVLAFYGIARFRLAADIAVVVLAAVALDAAVTWWRRRWRAPADEGPPAAIGVPAGGRDGHGDVPATATAATEPATRAGPSWPGDGPAARPDASARVGHRRFPCLDAYRAIGMVMILVFHAAYATGFLAGETPVSARLAPWLARLDVGVPVFLILSAFLLFRPFASALLDGRPLPDTRRFYRRRVARILPVYWAALAVVGVVAGFDIHGARNWVANIFLLPAVGVPAEVCPPASPCHVGYAMSHVWTIGVLLAFYLALPPGARLLQRLAGSGATSTRATRVLALLAAIYLATNVLRAAIVAAEPAWAAQSLLSLPLYGDWLALGMALATVSVAGTAVPAVSALAAWAGAHPLACWLAAAALFVVITRFSYPTTPFGFRDAQGRSDYVVRQFLYGLIAAVSIAPAVFGDQRAGRGRRFLSAAPFAALGAISLSFYLYHPTAIEKAKQWTVPDWFDRAARAAAARPGNVLDAVAEFTGNLVVVVVIAGLLTTLVAALSYRLVEVPFLRRTVARPPGGAAATAAATATVAAGPLPPP